MAIMLTRREFLKLSLVVAGQAGADWVSGGPLDATRLKGSFVPLAVASRVRRQSSGPCLALVQSPWLGMAALGDNTMPDPNQGNHLRWGFESLLGFPDFGFDLYRRPHSEGQPVCVFLQGYEGRRNLGKRTTLGDLLLESSADIWTVELVPENGAPEIDLRGKPPLTIWPREVCHRIRLYVVDFNAGGGTIRARAFDGGMLVAEAKTVASGHIQPLELMADRIDRVVIDTPRNAMEGVLTQVCYATVAADVCNGQSTWTRLNKDPICLPLSDASYPGPSKPATPADEWPAAQRRIPPDVWAQYDPPEFTDLRDTLARIYHPDDTPLPAGETSCPPSSGGAESPAMAYDPLGVVLLSTLDPYIARMLGLYWIDGAFYVDQELQVPEPAPEGIGYDYLIVAHYPDTADSADACDGWDGDTIGTTVHGTVYHGPLTYDTPVPLSVANRSIGAFGTTKALSIPDNLGNPLRITLPEPAQAVELYVDVPTASAQAIARAYFEGDEVDTATRPTSVSGPTILLLLAESIDAIELEGTDLYLAKTCYYTDYLPGGDIGFAVYNVVLGRPPALAAPSSLNGDPLAVLSRLDADCNPVTGQMAAGLRWDRGLDGDEIVPGGAVLYDLERQGLGNGDAPDPVDPSAWQTVRSNIMVTSDLPQARCEPYEALPGWPAARADCIDMPPDDPQQRWYAYRVRGVDIFGRRSAFRESVSVDLADTIPPPPPADVHAKYLDPNDPYLSPDEYAWTHLGGSPRHGLRVGWRWTENLQRQAPDVAQFRVYFQPGRLNVILDNITAVGTPDGSGNVLLTTDVTVAELPAGDVANAFQGEFLSQGVNLYQVVASGSTGGFLILTVKRETWEPPGGGREIEAPELQPMPTTGPFSLSVRPPQLLAGTLTRVSVAEFPGPGTPDVTVETDVRYTGAPNDLAGLKLRQGGRLWEITGNTTGWKFEIYLQSRECEPGAPLQGEGVLVVEADGVTPRLLDPGNVHARDYRDPLQWEQRLHLEPRTPEPAGRITAVVDNGDGTSTVTTDQTLTDPSGHYLGGELQVGGYTWPVIGHTTGASFRLTVLNNRRDRLTGEVSQAAPPTGFSFTYWPDIVIPIAPLTIPSGQPAAYAAVGVSAADDKPYVADPWPGANGGQHGNESRISPPAIVARMDRSEPSAPTPNTDILMATPADFYGRSFFTVRWVKHSEPNLRYRVYRALAEPDGSEPLLECYRLITPEPLRPEDYPDVAEPGHAADPALMAYRDTLDGRSTSRYYYRVRAVNAAGTPGEWSAPIGPVACPDVVPPRAPAITKVLGGDRQITLRWASNREPDLTEYRVYRADSREAAGDLRLMTLVHTEPAPAGSLAEIEFADTTVVPYRDFFYRVVAVDDAGNISQPSQPVVGQAFDQSPPEPPTWERAEWVKLDEHGRIHAWSEVVPGYRPAILLAWHITQPDIRLLVQRRLADGDVWISVSKWFKSEPYSRTGDRWSWLFYDKAIRETDDYVYRIKLVNRARKTTFSEEMSPTRGG